MLREKLEETYITVLTKNKTHTKLDTFLTPMQFLEFTKEIRLYLQDTAEASKEASTLRIEYVTSEGGNTDDTAISFGNRKR